MALATIPNTVTYAGRHEINGKDEIWPTGPVLRTREESNAQQLPHQDLWLGASSSDAGHHPAARFRIDCISQGRESSRRAAFRTLLP